MRLGEAADMKQARSVRPCHIDRLSGEERAFGAGVSFAEWRFETNAGRRAFIRDDYKTAEAHFTTAVLIAERLAALASLGSADPRCAIRAMIAARRNLAENYLRFGLVEEADNALEIIFLQLCAVAKSPGSPLQNACGRQVSAVSKILLTQLKRSFTSPARIVAIQAITEEALKYFYKTDPSTDRLEQL